MVQEGVSAQLRVLAFGFPDDPFSFRIPVEAYILLYTSDNTAEG